MLIDKLEHLGQHSVYHRQEALAQGWSCTRHSSSVANQRMRTTSTLRSSAMESQQRWPVAGGRDKDWLVYSDRMPLILDVEDAGNGPGLGRPSVLF